MTALRPSLPLRRPPAPTARPPATRPGGGDLGPDPVALAVDALAVYRLARLVIDDTILDAPRDAVHRRLAAGGPVAHKVAEGLDCYWCAGLWIACAAAAARRTRAWRAARYPLAVSACVGILADR